MKTLSIVVPSYNTENYIDECLPSILNVRNFDDIELLLINDGSTDHTLEKLRKYEALYPSSIRVIDKKNGGHGSVINVGIKEARGKYFKVVDGDDWVLSNGLEHLVEELKNTDTDLVLNPYYTHHMTRATEQLCGVEKLGENVIYNLEEIAPELQISYIYNITYKTELLRASPIHFQEKCYYEDAEYHIYPYQYIRNVKYLGFPVYVYRIGCPTQSVSPANAIRNRAMLRLIVDNLLLYYENAKSSLSPNVRSYTGRQICEVIKNMYGVYLKMPVSKQTYSEMHDFDRHYKELSKDLYQSMQSKSVRLLRIHWYPVYPLAAKLFEKKRRKRGF